MTHHTELMSLRIAARLTERNVALILGVTQPAVSVLESGRHTPRADTLARYYAAVGRMDLADPLRLVLSEGAWSRVEKVNRNYNQLADGLRQSQRPRSKYAYLMIDGVAACAVCHEALDAHPFTANGPVLCRK